MASPLVVHACMCWCTCICPVVPSGCCGLRPPSSSAVVTECRHDFSLFTSMSSSQKTKNHALRARLHRTRAMFFFFLQKRERIRERHQQKLRRGRKHATTPPAKRWSVSTTCLAGVFPFPPWLSCRSNNEKATALVAAHANMAPHRSLQVCSARRLINGISVFARALASRVKAMFQC